MNKTLLDLLTKERERTVTRLAALDSVLNAYNQHTGVPHSPEWKENISMGLRRSTRMKAVKHRTKVHIGERKAEIERVLRQVDGASIPEIMRILHCSETATRNAVEALEDEGKVQRSKGRSGPDSAYLYRLNRDSDSQVALHEEETLQ